MNTTTTVVEATLSNSVSGKSISLAAVLAMLPEEYQPDANILPEVENFKGCIWYCFQANGNKVSIAGELVYLETAGNDQFVQITIIGPPQMFIVYPETDADTQVPINGRSHNQLYINIATGELW